MSIKPFSMPTLIDNLTDTARWVAAFRAEESERPDALFHDPYARLLAGERGELIANTIKFGRKNSWMIVARTWLLDKHITAHIQQGYDTIINLAAGLDTRPYRMQLPSSLQWIEVDMPGFIRYKQEMLANETPVCRLEQVQLDLSDRMLRMELFKRINNTSRKALVICEGLLIYLSEQQVAELASDLSAQHNFIHWTFDLQSPALLAAANKAVSETLNNGKTLFTFGPANGELFFHDYGWETMDSRSLLKTAAVLNRLPDELATAAALPEPPQGPKGDFSWSGICLMENNYTN